MKITAAKLIKNGACADGVNKYFADRKSQDVKTLFKHAMDNKDYDSIRYGLAFAMTHKQRIKWAIYCAEQGIQNYESKYPDDPRPLLCDKSSESISKKSIG